MKKNISLITANNTCVPIVTGLLPEQLAEYIPRTMPVLAIVDEAVQKWFHRYVPGIPTIVLQASEDNKTLATVERLTLELLELGGDRTTFLLGVGGGVVCDITGFLAAVYMRGIPFGFIPTTLLAQVDAALGGKNGVNVHRYKNMAGTFTQPQFVLSTVDVLHSLPQRTFNAGMAEVIKAALIADAAFFEYIEQHVYDLLNRKETVLEEVINRAVQIKVNIVAQDEKEKGERRKLNLGHTIGHAIEHSAEDILHGEAISIGIAYAARFSQQQNWLSAADAMRISNLLQRFHLPVTCVIPTNMLHEALLKDKKKTGGRLHYIALSAIGQAVEVAVDLSDKEIFI